MSFADIPRELQELPRWVHWRSETTPNGTTKVPYVPGENRRASTTDSGTWSDFGTAVSTLNGHGGGIGFVFNGDGIAGIDLDHARDTQSGVITPWAVRLIEHLNSYTETSPSGTGIHILTRGDLPAGRRKAGPVEAYSAARYFTVTGNCLEGVPATIERRDLAFFHRMLSTGLFANEDFLRLANSDNSAFPSASEADLSFCGTLAHAGFSGEEIDRAVRLFRFRPKWDERRGNSTYGNQTIQTVLAGRTSTPVPVSSAPASCSVVELICGAEGRPKPILENVLTVLRNSPEWAGVLGYNEFTGRTTMRKAAPGFPLDNRRLPREWTDNDDTLSLCWMQRAGILINSTTQVGQAIQSVAHENPFHPVRDYWQGLPPWDGVERLPFWLIAYFEVAETEFVKNVSVRWVISGVARIFEPGCQVDHTLLLEGKQGEGKSSGLRALVGDEWFADNISTLGSKDSRQELTGKLVVEISELSAMRRAEVEAIKSFLSERVDHYRLPYAKRATDVPRQNIFAATTNAETPLADETGARRFWPVRTGRVDFRGLEQVRDLIWSEAYARYRQNQVWWLETAELNQLAQTEQDGRYQMGARDEAILDWIRVPQQRERVNAWDDISPWNGSTVNHINIQDCLIHGLRVSLSEIKQSDFHEVGRCLRHLGWTARQETAGPHRGKRYYEPKARTL